jgi:hypothetical protein
MEMTGMATDTATNVRDEFRNTTDGWIGVVQFVGPHREPKGTAVEPHGTVWLNEDEQILTANAPKADADNPFVPRSVVGEDGELVDAPPMLELVSRGTEIKSRRPYGINPGAPETGAAPVPESEPAEGQRAAGEEVATPAAMRKRRA